MLVIFGGYIGYSGDDINKFLWMVRIGGGEHPKEIQERDFLTSQVRVSPNSNVLSPSAHDLRCTVTSGYHVRDAFSSLINLNGYHLLSFRRANIVSIVKRPPPCLTV